VHEFLIKPISPKALRDRLMSIVYKPRSMMQLGELYVPKPRHAKAEAKAAPHDLTA
jgi:two-component system, chemotaxis family, chemotaxis protein CheY